jgi:hypothetical protein
MYPLITYFNTLPVVGAHLWLWNWKSTWLLNTERLPLSCSFFLFRWSPRPRRQDVGQPPASWCRPVRGHTSLPLLHPARGCPAHRLLPLLCSPSWKRTARGRPAHSLCPFLHLSPASPSIEAYSSPNPHHRPTGKNRLTITGGGGG